MIEPTETLLELPLLALRLDLPLAVLQSWIEAGLEYEQWNGRMLTSREALKRFWSFGDEAPGQRQVVALRLSLRSRSSAIPDAA